ncbi:hypothetical protein PNOK_0805100 [Pyrrhoderma noxium]|uniref:Uncharacterized protein n=1 Tax=Pyrrhoderma noxium TaxID=2282107 RepID=A0A286UA22_9AGAM|nr:hypothetical protein PNOK_0805100 [Pyrrhoderma noxium]
MGSSHSTPQPSTQKQEPNEAVSHTPFYGQIKGLLYKMFGKITIRKWGIIRSPVTTEVQHGAEFEGWRKIEYFKMHFRPAGMEINTNGLELGTLPDDLSPTKVMGDFLRYLYTEALEYIKTHHIDGREIINEVGDNKSFILSLPNGWTGLPQQRMREAAVIGGLVKNDNEARTKIGFVSEGEASALACLANGLCPPNLKLGYRFIIADAGGGTLDITSYEVTKVSPTPEMKEITSSDCRFAGSVFVNMKAREFLKSKEGTRFLNQEQLDDIINERFELDTKRRFSNISDTHWLKIGERQDNNEEMGLIIGKLRFEGTDIVSFFDFSVTEALESIKQQVSRYGGKPMLVWLVGGFGGSPWLLKQLQEGLKDIGVEVSCHDTNLSKAVASGNVLFALEHTVYGLQDQEKCYNSSARPKHSPSISSQGDLANGSSKLVHDLSSSQICPHNEENTSSDSVEPRRDDGVTPLSGRSSPPKNNTPDRQTYM